ncbi:MAG: trehalose-phosphatase [Salegentibacter sp.]|uniref:trehalose-phosphatase n=1 Tax=Salegentibacter sp. TaxID=1903072 RepID=UPI0028708D06|nr:trehalose-phosphatase [Salegentibacter sp.]MDR9456949.1 trehalose-phosphatase [Salegentibacter sp.]
MSKIKNLNFGAVILDMDGVITKTARVHAKAWKKMFDEFLEKREGENFQPLDIKIDYNQYIDGIPRLDGIRGFLKSRNIDIPEGNPDDEPEKNTVHGLGKRKNKIFRDVIEKDGVRVYEDAVEMIKKWEKENIKLAVISSSRNCKYIMEKTGLEDKFEVRVDGNTLKEENLRGKPEPDMFVKAAEYLNVKLEDTIIIEDAIQGVQAGKKGRFACVVGVARNGKEKSLKEAGADIVVKKLTELLYLDKKTPETLPNALEEIEELFEIKGNRKITIFLDYDGTLTPIISDPDAAELPDDNRKIIAELSNITPVAIISGRDLKDLKSKIEIDTVIYAGSHGFDISGPDGLEMVHESEKEVTPALDEAEKRLKEQLKDIRGAKIERKKFAIAVHYRNVEQKDVQEVKDAVHKEADRQDILKTGSGKKVLELKPNIDWNKGYALDWLTEKLGWDKEKYLRIYLGDDITDEDGFEALRKDGVGVLVSTHGEKTSASFALRNTKEVTRFLQHLKDRIK